MKHAIVIGATGMVGKQLIIQLLDSTDYSKITSLSRKKLHIFHHKFNEYIIDFEELSNYTHLINGDVLFSTLGTTKAKSKTKETQFKVDFHYQLQIAKLANSNGIQSYVLVSSAGANSSSLNFYLRMKGQLEDEIRQLTFTNITILQPGQIDGKRNESRTMEKLALYIMYVLNTIGLLKKYRPIQAFQVAQAMIQGANLNGTNIIALNQVIDLAKSGKTS
jgi:uncharacterized protein YbjT (DUF2867 family)